MIKSMDDEQSTNPAGYLRVLLGDDNIVEQKIAARMFRMLGYDVDVVSNGFEIVQAVRLKPYDVVIIDEEMPVINAFETASRIRALPALWKQPWIISLAILSNQVAAVQHRAAGINDVLNKPLNEEMLREALCRVSPNPSGLKDPTGFSKYLS